MFVQDSEQFPLFNKHSLISENICIDNNRLADEIVSFLIPFILGSSSIPFTNTLLGHGGVCNSTDVRLYTQIELNTIKNKYSTNWKMTCVVRMHDVFGSDYVIREIF